MNFWQSIALGILQGLTEFLPVSSSGHLVIAQNMLGFEQPGVLFDVVLHCGTTLAVVVYFRKTLITFIKKYFLALIIGTIPAVIIGLLFRSIVELLFTSVKVVGVALLITAVLNFLSDKAVVKKNKLSLLNSLFVGIAQGVAIIPGISRSGSTIFAATNLGINKRQAAEFSFILSIPAILGASLLETYSYLGQLQFNAVNYLVGFVAAFFSGYLAISVVLSALSKKKFFVFGVYCAALGILVLIL